MSQSSSVFFLICVALLIKDFSDCCTDSELVRGCRLATSDVSGTFECLCGAGCEKEFPFKSRTECETVLKGMFIFKTQLKKFFLRANQPRRKYLFRIRNLWILAPKCVPQAYYYTCNGSRIRESPKTKYMTMQIK